MFYYRIALHYRHDETASSVFFGLHAFTPVPPLPSQEPAGPWSPTPSIVLLPARPRRKPPCGGRGRHPRLRRRPRLCLPKHRWQRMKPWPEGFKKSLMRKDEMKLF